MSGSTGSQRASNDATQASDPNTSSVSLLLSLLTLIKVRLRRLYLNFFLPRSFSLTRHACWNPVRKDKSKKKKEKRTFKTKIITDPPNFPPTPKQLPTSFYSLDIANIAKSFKKHHVIVNMPFYARPPAGPPTARRCAPDVAGKKWSFRSEDGISSEKRRSLRRCTAKQSEVQLQERIFEGFFFFC